MPIFDYNCAACDKVFEKLVLPWDKSVVTCPVCSGEVEQMASAPVMHNTSSHKGVLHKEYKAYRKRWNESAYMPKPKKQSKH